MRKPRELQNGARYHVIARANRKEMVMKSAEMKELFLEIVKRAKKKFDFKIDNFCIMGNHFHMIIEPYNSSSLSKIMQWILMVFAIHWNFIHKTTGHVWGDRFFSRIIKSFREFLDVFWYIDRNPLVAMLVENATDWEYGALFHRRKGKGYLPSKLPDYALFHFPQHQPLLLI